MLGITGVIGYFEVNGDGGGGASDEMDFGLIA